jgi:photosystem II Psb28-2 protein
MTAPAPLIEFFAGVPEELSNVSLRRNKSTGERSVILTFTALKSLERFRSFTRRSANALFLTDEEGQLRVEPSGVKLFLGGEDGDEFQRLECQFEIDRDDHWERFMRFMHRYAEANGMSYGDAN